MKATVTNLVGWIPAIVLPVAAFFQLFQIARQKSAAGVSLATWLLFGIANVSLYIFTEKYSAPQCILGLLGTAVLNFAIVGLIIFFRRKR